MRKFKTYLITVLVSLILIFCISHSKNTKDNMLIDKVPMAEKLTKMNINDIYKLKKEIEHIPLESCEVFFTDEIEIFLNNYNDIKLDSLHVEQDTLSVIAGQNNKSLYNLIFEINIVIDTTKNVNIYDDIIEISNGKPKHSNAKDDDFDWTTTTPETVNRNKNSFELEVKAIGIGDTYIFAKTRAYCIRILFLPA